MQLLCWGHNSCTHYHPSGCNLILLVLLGSSILQGKWEEEYMHIYYTCTLVKSRQHDTASSVHAVDWSKRHQTNR